MSSTSIKPPKIPTSPGDAADQFTQSTSGQDWDPTHMLDPTVRGDPDRMTHDPLSWVLHPVETGTAWLFNESQKPDPPDTKNPGAPPTQNQANQVSLNTQLQQEGSMRYYSSPQGGLLDDQPKTASQVLLGS